MPAHFSDTVPVLIVDRIESSRAFFCDRLGFSTITEVTRDGALGFALLRRNDAAVMLRSDADLRSDFGENYIAGPYMAMIYIRVDDVELIVPEVADADVVIPLRRTNYDMREIAVREPGGNIVVFASPV